MKELIERIARELVDQPDQVSVTEIEGGLEPDAQGIGAVGIGTGKPSCSLKGKLRRGNF